jgi:L-malate glycosyltransferase
MQKVKVHQFLPTLSSRDAIGNEALLMQQVLRDAGFQSDIYVERSEASLKSKTKNINTYPFYAPNASVLIFHYSVASDSFLRIAASKSAICLRYHNVTPAHFFHPIHDATSHFVCRLGRDQLEIATSASQWGLADSRYNELELNALGLADTKVMPLLRNYSALANNTTVDQALLQALRSTQQGTEIKNLTFVGRLAPNKKQEDLIELLYAYHRHYSENTRLVIVGSPYSKSFLNNLVTYAKDLNLNPHTGLQGIEARHKVVVTGSVSDNELATIYRSADAFVCASEHEGFCVPIVEAMGFEIPILTHNATALPGTVGSAGLVTDKFDKVLFVKSLHSVLTDTQLINRLKENARKEFEKFSLSVNKLAFIHHVSNMVDQSRKIKWD